MSAIARRRVLGGGAALLAASPLTGPGAWAATPLEVLATTGMIADAARTCAALPAMACHKAIVGPGLKARTIGRQQVGAAPAVRCLDRFTALGMRVSVKIT